MDEGEPITVARLVRRMAVQSLLLAVLLFVPAGTLAWPRGWILIGVAMAAVGTIYGWMFRHDQALLRERLRGPFQQGQARADRLVTGLLVLAGLAWFVAIPLDVFRWRLLPPPPRPLSWAGMALLLAGYAVIFATFRANSFAAPVVKDQAQRQQTVIESGPYAVVRHPMYSGMVLVAAGVSLWLGSWVGLAIVALPLIALVARILVEERHLRESLAGYDAYAARVRWRLAPLIW